MAKSSSRMLQERLILLMHNESVQYISHSLKVFVLVSIRDRIGDYLNH